MREARNCSIIKFVETRIFKTMAYVLRISSRQDSKYLSQKFKAWSPTGDLLSLTRGTGKVFSSIRVSGVKLYFLWRREMRLLSPTRIYCGMPCGRCEYIFDQNYRLGKENFEKIFKLITGVRLL